MSGAPYAIKIDEYKPELEPGPSSPAPATQARKSDRACDFCRRRKTRCDGAPTLNAKCTNCKRNQCPCTYLEASRPRGPPKAYVTALEDRIERFERLFKRLRPDANFTDILGPPIPRGSWKSDQDPESNYHSRQTSDSSSTIGHSSTSQSLYLPSHASLLPRNATERESGSEESYSSDDEFKESDWPRRRLTIRGTSQVTSEADSPNGTCTGSSESPMRDGFSSAGAGSSFGNIGEECSIRFIGKSSLFPLVNAARRYMRDTAGDDGFHEPGEGFDDVWSDARRTGISDIPRGRRRMFWTFAPWEEAWENNRSILVSNLSQSTFASDSPQKLTSHIFEFPPSDLTLPLLSLYFHHTNTIFPLLHAPTFYAQFRDCLHLRDAQFASVVWAVLAVASRWSDDRRVLWDGWGSENSDEFPKVKVSSEDMEWASAGWRFFSRSMDGCSFTVTSLDPPSLFDLQCCSLGSMFLRGSSIGAAGWVVVGMGLRKAMDVGAHRKKVYSTEPSVENELWKRAFWMLVLFDRFGSASLGRPCCVREEDFDLDYPLEVDDEYWIPSDPSQPAFKQPEGKPARVSGFISLLKISQIKAHALRTIYCIDKSKVLLGLVSHDWQEQIVSQLNTALDEWVESVPQHLRWSSGIQDDIFSNQSATIYTTYYLTLILIYRPFSQISAFIAEPSQDAPARPSKTFPFPADSICTSAAHSAIRIVDEQTRRGLSNIPNMISVAHIAAVMQLMSMHFSQVATAAGGARNVDLAAKKNERERYLQDVEKCIRCLELAESRWIMARKFLTSIKSSMPEPGSTLRLDESLESPPSQAGPVLPTASSQPWYSRPTPTRPTSRMSEAEQALKNHANWRWFHENVKFAQQRFGGPHSSDPLRHHVVVPSTRHVSPTPLLQSMKPAPCTQGIRPILPDPTQAAMNNYAATSMRSEIGRRVSVHSISPPPTRPSIVPDQPISSISRAVRASTSGQFLSVTAPQSAAREELGTGSWNATSRQQMRVPSHPYATLHQTSRQMYRHSPERQYPSRGTS